MRRFSAIVIAREIINGCRTTLTGAEFMALGGYSRLPQLQAAVGVSDRLIDRALLEDNIIVSFVPVFGLPHGCAPAGYLRAGGFDIGMQSWSAKLVRPVRPILRRRPAHALAI